MGERIALYNVNEKNLLKALAKAKSPSHKKNALKMKEVVRRYEGVKVSVEKMNALIS